MEWPEYDQHKARARIDPKFQGLTAIALEVRGPSMNRIFPPGIVVICAAYGELGRGPIDGERVVVQRRRGEDGEISIREYRVDKDGIAWLWPVSDHADFQSPLRLDQGDEDEETLISHKVMRAEIDQP